jgi:hypothetical protein
MATSNDIRKEISNITSKPTTNDSSYELSKLQQDLKIANKQEVFEYMIDKGIPYNAVLGIMGNIDHETGGTFDYTQKQKNYKTGEYYDDKGYGLFQFDGLKRDAYELYTKDRPDSMEAQIDFMYDSIYSPNNLPGSILSLPPFANNQNLTKADLVGVGNARNLKEVFAKGSTSDVATAFMNQWEMPKDYILHKENPENQDYYEAYQSNLNQRINDATSLKEDLPMPIAYTGDGLGKIAMADPKNKPFLPSMGTDEALPRLAKQ